MFATSLSSSTTHQTTLVVSNLHCPSCITTIERLLNALEPRPASISHSLLSHTITISHPESLPPTLICSTLESAGYDIDSVFVDPRSPEVDFFTDIDLEQNHQSAHDDSWPLSLLRQSKSGALQEQTLKRKRHVENCDLCQQEGFHDYEKHGLLRSRPSSLAATSTASCTEIDVKRQSLTDTQPVPDATIVPLSGIVISQPESRKVAEIQLSISGMTCSACVTAISNALKEKTWIQPESISVNLVSNSASMNILDDHQASDVVELIDDLGYEAAILAVTYANTPAGMQTQAPVGKVMWKASWAIGGMTCSACVSAINTALEEIPYISRVDVNLVGHSAVIVFDGKEHVSDIKEAIEDLGYDADLDVLEEMAPEIHGKDHRKVAIKIDGMYCETCPTRIEMVVSHLPGDIVVERLPTLLHPILYLDYVPDLPRMNIRTILRAISGTDVALEVSIYHPPTMEERSRKIYAREQKLILARVILTLVLAIPTLIVGIVYMDLVSAHNTTRRYLMAQDRGVARAEWILLALATPVYFFAADLFHRRTLKELRVLWRPGSPVPYSRRFLRFGSMNMLVSLGTSIAYWSSVGILIASVAHPDPTVDNTNDFYFDSVVFLTLFLLLGRLMEAYSKAKTGDAVSMLGKLRPSTALLVQDEAGESSNNRNTSNTTITPTSLDLLDLDDIIRIPQGASPPFDGVITSGQTTFDESSLTGESKPVAKTVGDTVYSGTVNTGTAISIRLTGTAGTSMLDQIIKVVQEGQARRAPIERLADVITGRFVPVITLISIVTWVTWLSLGLGGILPDDYLDTHLGGWSYWSLQFAIAVFVVACPCGIGLAAPTALFVAGGIAAKHGILVKGGGEAFQDASKVDIVCFDKTGTLTMGIEPTVTDHEVIHVDEIAEAGITQAQLFGMIKRLEEDSTHPLAKAVVSWCSEQDCTSPTLLESQEITGKGMHGRFALPSSSSNPASPAHAIDILIGNTSLLSSHASITKLPPHNTSTLTCWSQAGKSLILIAIRTSPSEPYTLAALLATADPIRPSAARVVQTLQNQHNIAVWMLTGDNATTAAAVAAQVGIPASNVIAGVLPAEKAEKISWLQRSQSSGTQSRRAVVAMLGDGTNDAPALAAADVSIAISHSSSSGSSSGIAMSAASFVLLTPNLDALLTLLELSRAVFRRIVLNFAWALVYNCVGVPVAAGVLFPIRTGGGGGGHVRLAPVWAALAMAMSSVSVVGSSLLLRTRVPVLGFRTRRCQD